jgi:short-subunit dehydrogenase
LVLAARRQEALAAVAEQIRSAGGMVETVIGDATDPAARAAALEAARTRLGGLDILINNAGVGAVGEFAKADPGRLRPLMELNFFALVELTRAALPLLLAGRRPLIVNVGSILGHRAVPRCSEYCASKFAVRGFSESLRAELAPRGIDVLLVSPGSTETEFSDHLLERSSPPAFRASRAMSAEAVARDAIRAMRSGRNEALPGWKTKAVYWLNRLSPRVLDRIAAKRAKQMSRSDS